MRPLRVSLSPQPHPPPLRCPYPPRVPRPSRRHSKLICTSGLCTSCSFCPRCSSPNFPMAGSILSFMPQCRLLGETSLMMPSTEVVPTPSHSPSHLCFSFLFALIGSGYFPVHQFCCSGCCVMIVVFHPCIYRMKAGTQVDPVT